METIVTPTGKIHCGSTPIKAMDEDVPTGGWWHAIHFLEGAVTETECPRCGALLSIAAVEPCRLSFMDGEGKYWNCDRPVGHEGSCSARNLGNEGKPQGLRFTSGEREPQTPVPLPPDAEEAIREIAEVDMALKEVLGEWPVYLEHTEQDGRPAKDKLTRAGALLLLLQRRETDAK